MDSQATIGGRMSKREKTDKEYREAARKFLERQRAEDELRERDRIQRLARGEVVDGVRLVVTQAGTEEEEV
tara:strand:- start:89 stop:301 length:213 start_codon:yes stop_codon:yes gene_type:complete